MQSKPAIPILLAGFQLSQLPDERPEDVRRRHIHSVDAYHITMGFLVVVLCLAPPNTSILIYNTIQYQRFIPMVSYGHATPKESNQIVEVCFIQVRIYLQKRMNSEVVRS